MQIKDIQTNASFDFVKVRIISKNGPRLVGKAKKKYVTDILIIDKSGKCTLTIWGKTEADKYRVGKILEIRNGWAKEYMGQLQLSLGREGKAIVYTTDDPSIPKSFL